MIFRLILLFCFSMVVNLVYFLPDYLRFLSQGLIFLCMLFFPGSRIDLSEDKPSKENFGYKVGIDLIYISSLFIYFYWMIAYYFNITQLIYGMFPRTSPEILLIICFLFIFILRVPNTNAQKICILFSVLSLVILIRLSLQFFSPKTFWVINDLGNVLGGRFKMWLSMVLTGIVVLGVSKMWLSMQEKNKYLSILLFIRISAIVISIIGMANIQTLVFQNRGLRFYYTENSKTVELADTTPTTSSHYANGILEQWKK